MPHGVTRTVLSADTVARGRMSAGRTVRMAVPRFTTAILNALLFSIRLCFQRSLEMVLIRSSVSDMESARILHPRGSLRANILALTTANP
jgi:hypothetical protein